jgi:hypothetical protein
MTTLTNRGVRLSGFITPSESGDYEFMLRSDDAGQLFLSPDNSVANLALIAEETTCCGPFEETGRARNICGQNPDGRTELCHPRPL